jgi:hypothetical protein
MSEINEYNKGEHLCSPLQIIVIGNCSQVVCPPFTPMKMKRLLYFNVLVGNKKPVAHPTFYICLHYSSFPNSIWECLPRRSASCGGTRSVHEWVPKQSLGTRTVEKAFQSVGFQNTSKAKALNSKIFQS